MNFQQFFKKSISFCFIGGQTGKWAESEGTAEGHKSDWLKQT